MKKTLIALAVAASAVVSGSAMAWTANSAGNSVELSGTLTPVAKVTPWEVKTGDAVTNLNALVQKGQSSVTVNVNQAIPVLGIRTSSAEGFQGREGIAPQIDYKDAVDVNGFVEGLVTTVNLKVTNDKGEKIGSLRAPFFAAAERSYKTLDGSKGTFRSVNAPKNGTPFWGGVSKEGFSVQQGVIKTRVAALDSSILSNFSDFGGVFVSASFELDSRNPNYIFNAYYGSGIESGSTINITLDSPVVGDGEVVWNASLPVTVTYM